MVIFGRVIAGVGELMKIQSLANLAMHYLKQGNTEKYRSYAAQVAALVGEKGVDDADILAPENLQYLFQLGQYDIVVDAFTRLPRDGKTFWQNYLHGEALFRLGKLSEALKLWNELATNDGDSAFVEVRRRQALRCPEVVFGHALLLDQEPAVHVLILTHNRREYLRKTLACLRKTNYSNYKVYIVDNASTDGTRDILSEESKMFPPHVAVEYVSLPTNVGRPAGHNWLLTAWDHREADYLSILDDDLLDFPANWLKIFVNSIGLKPDVGVVGGKTVGSDLLIQDATSIITGITPSGSIDFFTNRGSFDWGQFSVISNISDYTIGCACMYKREVFDVAGYFDIRFSPSQGVDIDHGVRMRKVGYDMIYNGNVTFVHAQLTSEGLHKDRARLGNSLGNFLKLGYKYSPEEFHQIIVDRVKRQQSFDACGGEFW